jgi:hypothetical protein
MSCQRDAPSLWDPGLAPGCRKRDDDGELNAAMRHNEVSGTGCNGLPSREIPPSRRHLPKVGQVGHWANAKIVPWITSDLPKDR